MGVQTFEVDLDLINSTRDNMPMHAHRRYDVYGDAPHEAAGAARRGATDVDDERHKGLFFVSWQRAAAMAGIAAVPALLGLLKRLRVAS